MKKNKEYGIKGLLICFYIIMSVVGSSQTYENKITCEHIHRDIKTNNLKSADVRDGFVYTYKDMTLYLFYTHNIFYHTTNGVIDAPPTYSLKNRYCFFKNKCDTIYYFSDSLKLMQIFPSTKFDSLLTNNSLALTNFKPGYSDTYHYKIEKERKRKKRTVLLINCLSNQSKISKDNYIKVYLSKRKMYLHHQIAPDLDSIYGMRTYKVVSNYKSHKQEEYKKVKFFPFAKLSFTNKRYKISSDRKAEVIEIFDSCLVKSANPAGAIRNWFPKGTSVQR